MSTSINNIRVTMDSVEALLVSTEITKGEAIAACAGIIWEEKYQVRKDKVAQGMEIIRMHRPAANRVRGYPFRYRLIVTDYAGSNAG